MTGMSMTDSPPRETLTHFREVPNVKKSHTRHYC